MERRKPVEESKARELADNVQNYAWETANGSHEAAIKLIHSFVPVGPDDGPKIRLRFEILKADSITSEEKLALTIANQFLGKFGQNFGYDSQVVPTFENRFFTEFITSTAKTVHGIMQKDGPFGKDLLENMTKANDSYINLLKWADQAHA